VGRIVGIAGAVATALVCAASTAATAAAAPMPATVAVTSKPIIALAAGGGRVAYRTHFTDQSGGVCNSVHVLALSGGSESVPSPCSHTTDYGHGVALGAHALVYDSIEVEPLNATHDGADTTLWRVGRGGRTRLATESYEITCSGIGIGPFAYGAGVAYTHAVMTEVDPAMECQLGSGGGPGISRMTSATMRYVPAGSATTFALAGAPGAARIAARWPVLAIVPLRIPQPMGNRVTPPTGGTPRIESWDLRTRTRLCTAGFHGVPSAVATSGNEIAAVVATSSGHRFVRLLPGSCSVLEVRHLHGRVQPELALGRDVAAWVSGRSVMTLNLSNSHLTRIYRGTLVPHGLSLTNGRLVWWVTGRSGGSRVLRLPLP
jgi:hypothetical protein